MVKEFPRRKGYKTIVVVVAAVVIISAISLYYWGPFSLNSNRESQLRLTYFENTGTILSGQNITLTIEVYNTGPTSIFNVSDSWPMIGGDNNRMLISPCSFDLPYGFAIVPGYVVNGSVISAKPLNLWSPGVYNCPVIYPVSSYEITGLSDHAYILSPSNPSIPITLISTVQIDGYWAPSISIDGSSQFHYFPAGEYTVIVADEWGAASLLHFQVSSMSLSS